MPSLDSKEIAEQIIASNGQYMDDPPVIAVFTYLNNWGGTTYYLAYRDAHIESLYSSPYCNNIECIWRKQ